MLCEAMTRNARWAAAIKHKSCRGSKSQDVLACFESRSSRDRIHHNLQHSANDMRACTRVSCNWNWARPAETQPDLLQHHWPSAKTDIQKKQNIRPKAAWHCADARTRETIAITTNMFAINGSSNFSYDAKVPTCPRHTYANIQQYRYCQPYGLQKK